MLHYLVQAALGTPITFNTTVLKTSFTAAYLNTGIILNNKFGEYDCLRFQALIRYRDLASTSGGIENILSVLFGLEH